MSFNLKLQHDFFVKMSFEEKRNRVASLLEGIKEEDPLFADLYVLVMSSAAIEQDFYDIFDSLMIVLYREKKGEEQLAMDRLENMRKNMELQRKQENEEKLQGKKKAETLLVHIV